MKKRKICFITGTRAEYGILKPVMKADQKSKKLELCLIVSCMHLSKDFGYTIKEIVKDKFKISAKLDTNPKGDKGFDMALSVGKGIIESAKALKKIKPDFIVVLGDRIEMLSASIAAGYMNIPVVHLHGGEVSGNIDDASRHSITRFASVHLPATKKSAERIKKMGEEAWRIHVVGAPGLDTILNHKFLNKQQLAKKLKLNLKKKIFVVIQHSVTSQGEDAGRQMKLTLDAIKDLNEQTAIQTVIIYPNSDAGARKIIKEIEKVKDKAKKNKNYRFIKAFKSLDHITYLSLLKNSDVLIGNSSSGIIESSSFGLPVVNIGIRQAGRERAGNVINVPHDKNKIKSAIKKALSPGFKSRIKKIKNPYGDGRASQRIARVLSDIKIDKKLIEKKLTY